MIYVNCHWLSLPQEMSQAQDYPWERGTAASSPGRCSADAAQPVERERGFKKGKENDGK